MSRKDTAWLVAQIESVPILASRTFVATTADDPNMPTPLPLPYAVVWPSDGLDEATRLTGPRATHNPSFIVHSVGETADQAAWAFEAWKSKLVIRGVGILPVVDGQRTERVRVDVPQPIQVDKDVTPWLVFHTAEVSWRSHDQFDLTSSPA